MEPNTQPQPVIPVPLESPVNLLKSAWAMYKAHWKILISIVAVPYLFAFTGQYILVAHFGITSIIGFIFSIIGGVLSVAMYPAIVNAINTLDQDPNQSITVESQYKIGFSLFWSFILVGIIVVCVSFGSMFLLIIPGIVVSVYLSANIFTFVIDGKRGYSALTESYSLIVGRWWPTFGRMLFFALIIMIAEFIVFLLFIIIALVLGLKSHSIEYVTFSTIINFIFTSVFIPFTLICSYKLYRSLKATRIPNVSTAVFKKWLVAFTVIGPIFFVAMMIVIISISAFVALNGVDRNPKFQQMSGRYDGENWIPALNDDSTIPVDTTYTSTTSSDQY